MKTKTDNKVVITWKAFGDHADNGRFISSVEISVGLMEKVQDWQFLEMLYEATNLYRGKLWDMIEPKLSPTRTHTALSIGDEVQINNKVYRCEMVGWKEVK